MNTLKKEKISSVGRNIKKLDTYARLDEIQIGTNGIAFLKKTKNTVML